MSRTALFASALVAAMLAACAAAPTSTPTAAPAPTPTPLPAPPTTAPTPVEAPAADAFAPQKRSVWETTVGPDQMRGDCPKGSIVPPYGPVLITPRDDGGFDWRDVQNATYTFAPTSQGAFAYNGPNGRKDGVLTMTLSFKDEKSFGMQAEYVRSDAPACTHAYEYAGVYKFDR